MLKENKTYVVVGSMSSGQTVANSLASTFNCSIFSLKCGSCLIGRKIEEKVVFVQLHRQENEKKIKKYLEQEVYTIFTAQNEVVLVRVSDY